MSVGELLDRENDRPAYVRFEQRAVKDAKASLEAGYHVSKDQNWVLITPPYSKDCIEKKAETWLDQCSINVKKGRVPADHFNFWAKSYERWKEGLEAPVNGTSVKEWSSISPAECKNLLGAQMRTIEDLAAANDEGLRRLGMGGVHLKQKALAWLQAAKDHGPLTTQVTELQKENEQLKGSVDSLQEQVKLLTMQLDSKQPQPVVSSIEPIEDTSGISMADITETPAEQYEAKFGKKPHHMLAEKTMLERISKNTP